MGRRLEVSTSCAELQRVVTDDEIENRSVRHPSASDARDELAGSVPFYEQTKHTCPKCSLGPCYCGASPRTHAAGRRSVPQKQGQWFIHSSTVRVSPPGEVG